MSRTKGQQNRYNSSCIKGKILHPSFAPESCLVFLTLCFRSLSFPHSTLVFLHSHHHKHTTDGASALLSKSQSLGRRPVRRPFLPPFTLASRVTSAFWRRVCFCMFPPLIGFNDFRARIKTWHRRLPPLRLVTRGGIFKTGLKLGVSPPGSA